jgi:hypothetical protein
MWNAGRHQRTQRLNLTAALAVLAVVDLVFNRIVSRFFLPLPRPDTFGFRALTHLATFELHLGAFLGLTIFALTFVDILRRQELFNRAMRVTAATFALFFLFLAVPGTLLPDPIRLFVHLKISHAFLSWMIAIATWRTMATRRAKLGVTLVALPSIVHAAALFSAQLGPEHDAARTSGLFRLADLGGVVSAATAPLLLMPASGLTARARALGFVAGTAVAGLFVLGLWVNPDLVQALMLYGLHIEIPVLSSVGALIYVALLTIGLFGLTACVLQSLTLKGPPRLLAYGLVLVAAAGLQVATVGQLVISLCGLLAVALASRRVADELSEAPLGRIQNVSGLA